MKLSHDFFLRIMVIFGTVGTLIHGAETFMRKPHEPLTQWWGIHGFVLSGGIYALVWAFTKKSWWKDEE